MSSRKGVRSCRAGKSFLIRRPGASSKIVIFCDLARKDSARVPVGPPGSRTQYPLQSLLDASSWLKSEPAAMGDSCEQSFKLMIQAFSRIVHLSVSQLVL